MATIYSPASLLARGRALRLGRNALLLGGVLLGGLLTYGVLLALGLARVPGQGAAPYPGETGETGPDPLLVRFPAERWEAAGIKIAPATTAPLTQFVWRTGKVGLNERKVAQLSPLVEGVVREVRVRLGQDVKAGDVLLVIDSKELGQAKLELVKARLALATASTQYDWAKTVNRNTDELLRELAASPTVADLQGRFRGRAIGEWREKLITAYARRGQKKAQLDSLNQIQGEGAVSVASLRTARADYEAAEAGYEAVSEELHYQNRLLLRSADQKLREAQTQISVSATQLLMMGHSAREVESLDPVAEGAAIAHYLVRAPFDGTVLALHATLAERANPQAPLVQLADLSQVWVQADVPEADLPIVRGLHGRAVSFRGPGLPAGLTARVFHIGNLVDKTTRAVPLLATADNRERLLRPGLFVDVRLEYGPPEPVLQVPATALQRAGEETFVFVPVQGDEFRKVHITPGRANRDAVEIVAGLAAGQPVVVDGGFTLKFEMLRGQLTGE